MLVLLALNVAAELVSFSAVIDRVPPLRWLDRLGRVNAPPAPAPADDAGDDARDHRGTPAS